MASVSERVRWKTIRRGRLRRALTAVRDRRIADAFEELDHPAAAEDAAARVLHAIAMLMGSPTPENAERCVTELERAGEERDPEALATLVPMLERVLFQGPGHSPDRVAGVARLTERLVRLTGPLPWGHYNLAVHALCTGQFEAAVRHLSAGAVSPNGGWPLPLLGAACAAVLGDPAALAGSLTQPIRDSDVYHDHRLLFGIHLFFDHLRADRPIDDPASLVEAFGGPNGPLTRAVPQLAALKVLLANAVSLTAPPANMSGLDGCLWGQWLSDRLRHARADVIEVLAGSVVTGTEPPALLWQRVGTQQDLRPMVAEEAARELPRHLAKLAEPLSGLPAWAALVAQRVGLIGPVEDAWPSWEQPQAQCPWWPPAGVLEPLARQESRIESAYLTGRHELRLGRAIPARRWLGTGRAQLAEPGLATRLIALRFGPLVEYWDGVALAHQGRAEDATAQLHTCLGGIKDRDAKAQLGLLAIAGGARDEAERLLTQIADPRPASADHLTALLATGDDAPNAAAHLVDVISQRPTAAGIYRTAAHRLAGRVHETNSDLDEAVGHYRTALEHDPADKVAARRLVRVWTRQRYTDKVRAAQPPPDAYWSDVDAALPVVRDCLGEPDPTLARHQLANPPADPALRLLVIRHAVMARETSAAADAVREWTAADDPDPRLVVAARVIRGARAVGEFCRTGADDARAELTALAAEPGDGAGPVVGFWVSAAKALLDPGTATIPPSDDLPAPMRLFAGTLATFATDAAMRENGATLARAALDDAAPKDAAARSALECLIADALAEDGPFLLAYKEIETEDGLTALPWDRTASYLAAVEARLRVGQLDAIVDGFIPESLADLAAPGVRRAMGIAYARHAVKTADGDARAAMRDLDQARDLLTETP